MKRRRILYIFCLLIVLGVNIFYVEYQIFIMLVLMLVIPACSWFVYFISALGMGISMQIKNNVVLKGSKVHLRLIKKNKYNLAFVNGQIHVKYKYYHTGDEFSYTVDIKSGLGKSAGVIDIPVDYCGYIYLWVESIDMCDYLGLFHKRKKYTGLSKVYIVPEYAQADIIQTDGGYSEDMDDAVLYLKSAGDEVSELREYREGDSPRYIHWKKSSILAEDDFIIKEYDNNIYKTVFLVVDTLEIGKDKRLNVMSRIYQDAYSQGIAYLEQGIICEYVGWDNSAGNIVRYKFYDNETCMKALMGIMNLKCSVSAAYKACQKLYDLDGIELLSEPIIITYKDNK